MSGTVDDLIRHSISKLAHIHMVANQNAANRLIQMGEAVENIFVIGSPDLDVMNSKMLPTLDEVKQHYQIPHKKFALAIFHSVTSEEKQMPKYSRAFFDALKKSGDNFVIIYPNNDSGTSSILMEIEGCRGNPKFSIFPSIRFESFLVLLKNAEYIIGNSSAGIREAPFYGVPTVNIGTRQKRRYLGESIVNSSYESPDILSAIEKVKILGRCKPSNMFGDGNSVSKFAEALEKESFWMTEFQKSFVDITP